MQSSAEPRGVILVDGPSGAGKTEWAKSLHQDIGGTLVSLDDHYPGWDGLDAGSRYVFSRAIDPWMRGQMGRLHRWDWNLMTWGSDVTIDPALPLIVEGCGAISSFSSPCARYSYWLDADGDVRRTRALERDGDVFAPQWMRWARQEERFFAIHQSMRRADQVVRT